MQSDKVLFILIMNAYIELMKVANEKKKKNNKNALIIRAENGRVKFRGEQFLYSTIDNKLTEKREKICARFEEIPKMFNH